MTAAPPSLRVYILSKALGAPIVDVLAEDYELMRELECITAASAEAERRRHAAQQRQRRRGKGKR